jgi:lysophospholipase L1-like esterase
LRVVQALTPGSGTSADAAPRGQSQKNEQTQAVLRLIFEDLQRLHDRRGSLLILVYLHMQREIREPEPHPWVEWISREAQALGIPFINVLGAVRALPYPEATGLFRGHYNEAGHAFVARAVYEGLTPHLGHKPRHG